MNSKVKIWKNKKKKQPSLQIKSYPRQNNKKNKFED